MDVRCRGDVDIRVRADAFFTIAQNVPKFLGCPALNFFYIFYNDDRELFRAECISDRRAVPEVAEIFLLGNRSSQMSQREWLGLRSTPTNNIEQTNNNDRAKTNNMQQNNKQ